MVIAMVTYPYFIQQENMKKKTRLDHFERGGGGGERKKSHPLGR